jgi:hypothetical protein
MIDSQIINHFKVLKLTNLVFLIKNYLKISTIKEKVIWIAAEK